MTQLSDMIDQYVNGMIENEQRMDPTSDLHAGFRRIMSRINEQVWRSKVA